ncbi:hypothetical protein I4F81_002160 [Pyropia yezoensis]|uniref:Uncharacterized protein n=1 Tax=Pyropia yezoensis TaxID=2788 RepID=A0ACC3BP97_PYRYE|nr:hypothetical protein I4F81_002160 [Neopyropia yezoensis]
MALFRVASRSRAGAAAHTALWHALSGDTAAAVEALAFPSPPPHPALPLAAALAAVHGAAGVSPSAAAALVAALEAGGGTAGWPPAARRALYTAAALRAAAAGDAATALQVDAAARWGGLRLPLAVYTVLLRGLAAAGGGGTAAACWWPSPPEGGRGGPRRGCG